MANGYASHVHMFESMKNLSLSKSVRDVLGEEGRYVDTWGELNIVVQKEYDLDPRSIPLEVASRILKKLREWYHANEARKAYMK